MNLPTKLFLCTISFAVVSTASAAIPDFVTPGNNIAKQIIEGLRTKFTEIGNGRASGVDGLRGFGSNIASIRRNRNASLAGFKFAADDSVDFGDQNGFAKSELTFKGGVINRAGGADISVGIRSLNRLERMEGLREKLSGTGEGANANLVGESPLIGQVFDITSSNPYEISVDGRKRVDPFAMEISYDENEFNSVTGLTELQELLRGCLHIAWLNTGISGNVLEADLGDSWVMAGQGNFANWHYFEQLGANRTDHRSIHHAGITGLNMSYEEYYAGTTTVLTDLLGITKEANSFFVGDFGADLNNNTVWGVYDHNSQFGAVPEPSTYALILGGFVLGLALWRRR
ncbi:MAG: PEP-CTERM sorting domain-containing protein [Coraliomargaritaceae bacterium]